MSRNTLIAALAIQLALIGALLAARAGGVTEPEPFLRFDAGVVDTVTVADDEGEITLVKAEDKWLLPNDVPADGGKVDEVVEKLANASGGWPVATSASTAERFEVTEDNYQRHLTLKAGEETVADIYLGTSPGYRKTHARHVDDGDVYAITFANYQAGVKPADWLDKSLLRAKRPLTALRREGGFELTKEEAGEWTSADGTVLDQGKVETLAGRFTGLTVLGVSDAALPAMPTATFALTDEDGAHTFSLYRLPGEDDEDAYVATSDRVMGAYEISSYTGEQMDVTLAELVAEPAQDEEADSALDDEPAEEDDAP